MQSIIGETAGHIWKLLNTEGQMSVSQINKKINADTFTVAAAIGWLAREAKVLVTQKGKSRIVSLN